MFGFDVSDTEEARRTVLADEVDGKAKPTVFIVDRPQPRAAPVRDAATRVMQPIELARFRPPPPPLPEITGGTVRQRHTRWPLAIAAAAVVCSVLALVL